MTWPEQAPTPAKALSASFSHTGHQDDRELGFEPIKHTARRLKAFWGTQGRWPRRKIAGTSGLVWAGASGAQEAPQAQAQKKPARPQAGRAAHPRQGGLGVCAVYSFPVGMKSSSSSISNEVSIATPLGVSSQLST